jgi:hypothetical protein
MSDTTAVIRPYKGLIPYSEEDAQFFFGRNVERQIITANLMASRFTLLYGASGVGKSSVLRAGVAHHLRQLASKNLAEHGVPEFAVVVFSSWRDDLVVALLERVQNSVSQAFNNQVLERAPQSRTLADALQVWADRVGGDLLIILDQFEEYFLYHMDEDGEGTFAVEFARAVNRADLRVNFLISLREDAIAKLDRFKGRIPGLFDNYLRVEHLDPDAARDAIEKPVKQYNDLQKSDTQKVTIEGVLVDKVLDEVRTGRVIVGEMVRGIAASSATLAEARIETPYLQLVMNRLWDEEMRVGSCVLRLETLNRLGGSERIIRTHLDGVMGQLSPSERRLAAAVFHHLVTPSGTKIAHTVPDLAAYTKTPQPQLSPVLGKLSENRILRPIEPPPQKPDTPRYEIFHDVLAPAILDWRTRYAQSKTATRLRWAVRVGVAAFLVAVLAVVRVWWFQDSALEAEQEAAKFRQELIRVARQGLVMDEARSMGRAADSFPAADEDYFHDMDRGVQLTVNETKGRNTWIVWTGGNDRFWDHLVSKSFGVVDLLKIVSSHPKVAHLSRDTRWRDLGLVTEPCFEKPKGPRADRFGLWLDTRSKDCPPDPFENEQKYPGVKIGARGKNVPVGSYYGYASGIVGLRLFPNPDFDEAAQKKWDAEKFYTDKQYYEDKNLIRPYRVGMSCGFCHVGPSPENPPENPESPRWENLNFNVGAQYLWVSRVVFWQRDESSFIHQALSTSLPGTFDTSLISNDYINNPRSMNAIYGLGSRLRVALRWGKEKLAEGGLSYKQFQGYSKTAALSQFYEAPDTVWTLRLLKDGADSVGILEALNRFFIHFGLFSEEWLLHFNALVGGKPITPIKIEDAERNSSYWNATVAQTADVVLFFLKTGQPDLLKSAPGGEQYLTKDKTTLARGKTVFAEYCARCHSSKIPEPPAGVDEQNWEEYWKWTKMDDFKKRMTAMVMADDFLTDNYLSTDRRIPVTLLQTNACSPLATNALKDNMWDNFSSQTYKELPPVGKMTLHNPIDGSTFDYEMPGNGRGYTRVPSLISLWSTAPFLLNNSVGKFRWEPSVEARMDSFNDSIEQMLWPEKRKKDADVIKELGLPESSALNVPGFIYRTSATSYINIAPEFLPKEYESLLGWSERWVPLLHRRLPWLFSKEGVKIGPIPKGTPLSLLTNIDLARNNVELAKLLLKIKADLKAVEGKSEQEATEVFKKLVPNLLLVSKCPDFVVNKGHYFGTSFFREEPPLSDDEKRALIEYLKTF